MSRRARAWMATALLGLIDVFQNLRIFPESTDPEPRFKPEALSDPAGTDGPN